LLCLLSVVPAFPQQGAQNELDTLQKQIPALLNSGKLDEAISVSESIVKIEKLGGEKNLVNYYGALHNLALLKNRRLLLGPVGRLRNYSKYNSEVVETYDLLREFLDFVTKKNDTFLMAMAYSELAGLLRRHQPSAIEIEDYYLKSLSLRDQHMDADSPSTLSFVAALSSVTLPAASMRNFSP
jgi:hypothetical protein